jgi:hypothetical protein
MVRCVFVAIVAMLLGAGATEAQYARPVEVVPARPVAPAPSVVAPSPGLAAPTPPAPAPTITNPPTAVVPTPPPPVAQGATARPRKCWCYVMNPATNSRQRATCEINCCKGSNQDERC